jgi:hypothetical protein
LSTNDNTFLTKTSSYELHDLYYWRWSRNSIVVKGHDVTFLLLNKDIPGPYFHTRSGRELVTQHSSRLSYKRHHTTANTSGIASATNAPLRLSI